MGNLKGIGQSEEWQVIFLDSGDSEFPFTLESWDSKKEAEDWAESHEFEYNDEIWDPRVEDYVYGSITKYHNPEDGQAYDSFEIKKLK